MTVFFPRVVFATMVISSSAAFGGPSIVPDGIVFSELPDPMTCDIENPFADSFHTPGTRGEMTAVQDTLYIICPTQFVDWGDTRIPVNWYDNEMNGYTDCSDLENGVHFCWITVP